MIYFCKLKNEIRHILILAIPLSFSHLLAMISVFFSVVFISRLGNNALAASVAVVTIWNCIIAFFFALLSPADIIISQYFGKNNFRKIRVIFKHYFILVTVVSVVVQLILLLFLICSDIMDYSVKTRLLMHEYLFSLVILAPTTMLLFFVRAFLISLRMKKIYFLISVINPFLQIAFIYLLIFGDEIFPAMGIFGVGIGMAIANFFVIFITFIYFRSDKMFKFLVRSHLDKISLTIFRKILRFSLPFTLQQLVEVCFFMVFMLLASGYGQLALASNQIILQYFAIFIAFTYAITQAVNLRVSYVLGQCDKKDVYTTISVGILLLLLVLIIISLLILYFSRSMISIDISIHHAGSNELVVHANSLMYLLIPVIWFDTVRVFCFGMLRIFKDRFFSLLSSLVCFFVIGIVFAILLSRGFDMQNKGLWVGLMVGLFFSMLLLVSRIIFIFLKMSDGRMHSIKYL